jgi:hypothetical protein
MTPPLVFPISIPKRFGKFFVRVHVYDDRAQMLRAIKAAHGRHDHDTACTVTHARPINGRVADLFFTYRCARPGVIAHESGHAAWSVVMLIWGLGPDTEEYYMEILERFTDRIWTRIHQSDLR